MSYLPKFLPFIGERHKWHKFVPANSIFGLTLQCLFRKYQGFILFNHKKTNTYVQGKSTKTINIRIMHIIKTFLCIAILIGCTPKKQSNPNINLERAQQTLDSLYVHYSAPNTCLLRENYPFDETFTATYLASDDQANVPNAYSYLWPYSGTFSAVNALLEATGDKKYKTMLDTRVLSGLDNYYDSLRSPCAYSSYIQTATPSDRFYDDNIWIGIDFTDSYQMTGETGYLDKAKMIWKFIESGTDKQMGGGIYWCEQKKESKNTCSNAPGAVFALKLFKATQDSTYFEKGKALYEWTQSKLQDSTDYLYFDNIGLDGRIGKAKFAYNSGQMMQAATLLYELTRNPSYLTDAQRIAASCYDYFFTDFTPNNDESFRLLKKGDIWFTAVMLRGFIELYQADKEQKYVDAFNKNLAYAWEHARDDDGLFHTDWSGKEQNDKKWLLTQAAMVEMYARLAAINALN